MDELVVLDVPGGRLLGGLVLPPGEVSQAWLMCPPIFEERKSSLRPMVELARALAGSGRAVLRFDYRGCGDSSGELETFSPADWRRDAQAALSWLAERFPAAPLAVFGLRFGAAVALQAAQDPPCRAVSTLLLWAPTVAGADYMAAELRKKLMKEMLTFGANRTTREALIAQLEAGEAIDLDGYRLSPRLFREISATNMLADVENLCVERSLLVDVGPSERVSAATSTLASTLANQAAVVTRAVRMPQFWNQIGIVDCRDLIAESVAMVAEVGDE